MRCFRPASRAISHLLRHDPVYHLSSPASLFSRHAPFAPLSRAFDDPFFSSPFSSPLYTVYEMRDDSNKAEQHKNSKQEEAKAAEPQQQPQQQQREPHHKSNENRLARQEDSHRQRWLANRSNRRHRHHHHSHQPLSLFSPFDSLLTSPIFQQPLEISVDLYSTPAAYQVNAAIPGVRKEDIKLTVEDGVLTIEAERREERGKPAKATATPSASTASSADSASVATATTSAPASADASTAQVEPKTVEAEVKAEGVESKPAALPAETKAQETQPQQQQQQAEEDEDDDDVSVHHVESYYGRVQRSLELPDDVNVEGLTARYEDGVLKIELPRVEERKQQVKQINIQ